MSADDLDLDDAWEFWRARWGNRLANTMPGKGTPALYLSGLANLAEWARANGREDPAELTGADLDAYFAHFRTRKNKRTGEPLSGRYMLRDYTSLRSFYRYVAAEEGIADPMEKVGRPGATHKRIEIFTEDELERLIAACKGRGFVERRDMAIMRLLVDLGCRRGEIVDLRVSDLDRIDNDLPTVLLRGKTGERRIAIGQKTVEALAFYLRVRKSHKDSRRSELWLADPTQHRGALGYSGFAAMLRRRGAEAGVAGVHPHRFRHTAYNAAARANIAPAVVMTQFGWKSGAMLEHYARNEQESRAQVIMNAASLGDRIG